MRWAEPVSDIEIMYRIIYIEEEIRNHPRAKEICKRFPKATLIDCDRYGEIFNRRSQNFRLQKKQPALILAKKHEHFVLPMPACCPPAGGTHNFYFSHMLNCPYDCAYCFLRGMYQSAHHVIFVNYEDFQSAIEEKVRSCKGKPAYFFSGFDCDSLALDSVARFTESFLPFFKRLPDAWIELRTKSVQIAALLKQKAIANCIIAFSFVPSEISQALERQTPSVECRLEAMKKLGERGWKLGLRFDPIIDCENYELSYKNLFQNIFRTIRAEHLHSVNIGTFRLPKRVYETVANLYPDEKLLAVHLEEKNRLISYASDREKEMLQFSRKQLLRYIPHDILFSFDSICGRERVND